MYTIHKAKWIHIIPTATFLEQLFTIIWYYTHALHIPKSYAIKLLNADTRDITSACGALSHVPASHNQWVINKFLSLGTVAWVPVPVRLHSLKNQTPRVTSWHHSDAMTALVMLVSLSDVEALSVAVERRLLCKLDISKVNSSELW